MNAEAIGGEQQAKTEAFQHAFWAAKRAMADASETAFLKHGVRAGQRFILRSLWDEDGLTPGEIARRLELATPTVTKATMRMEASGLVIRRPHPSDHRLVKIHLTERGRSLRADIDREVERVTERALASISDHDRQRLIDLLVKIRSNLTQSPQTT
jgi:DNA-binding MarR family transcriptional regulator